MPSGKKRKRKDEHAQTQEASTCQSTQEER